jgi:hypothetical protein
MCYYLYGAVNNEINVDDFNAVTKNAEFHFKCGNIKDVNASVENCSSDYRITVNYCDCHTAIGQKHTNKKQLKDLEELLLGLRKVRGIKYILISKNWCEETNQKQETVHIDNVDILHFLANMEDNCLYKIELYKKYY